MGRDSKDVEWPCPIAILTKVIQPQCCTHIHQRKSLAINCGISPAHSSIALNQLQWRCGQDWSLIQHASQQRVPFIGLCGSDLILCAERVVLRSLALWDRRLVLSARGWRWSKHRSLWISWLTFKHGNENSFRKYHGQPKTRGGVSDWLVKLVHYPLLCAAI